MDLGKLIKPKERTLTKEFYPDFPVTLRYIPLAKRRRDLERAETTVMRGGRPDNRNTVSALEQLTAEMIKDWQLPDAVAVKLLEVEPEDLAGVAEIPCTPENKLALIRNVDAFSTWVLQNATVLEDFRAQELEAEIKN